MRWLYKLRSSFVNACTPISAQSVIVLRGDYVAFEKYQCLWLEIHRRSGLKGRLVLNDVFLSTPTLGETTSKHVFKKISESD